MVCLGMVRILVVDDEPSVRVLADRILSREGYWVQTAPNAREAIALVLYDLPSVPNLAILDFNLPGVHGVDFAGDLRRHFPEIRLVFMTGEQPRGAPDGAPVLMKPFHISELLAAVRALVGPGNR